MKPTSQPEREDPYQVDGRLTYPTGGYHDSAYRPSVGRSRLVGSLLIWGVLWLSLVVYVFWRFQLSVQQDQIWFSEMASDGSRTSQGMGADITTVSYVLPLGSTLAVLLLAKALSFGLILAAAGLPLRRPTRPDR